MDVPIGAATGGARLVLQVATGSRRPVLEVYANLRHRIGPEEVFEGSMVFGHKTTDAKYRPREVFIEFVLVNVGGTRAENISLSFGGKYEKKLSGKELSTIRLFRGSVVPQLPPGQVLPLFQLDDIDLYEYEKGQMVGMRTEGFTISAAYSGPWNGMNRLFRLLSAVRRRAQYRMKFRFIPALYQGMDIPPAEYS